jgi:hypothetical protein
VPARAELTLAALGLIHHCSAQSLQALANERGVTPSESWNVYSFAKALIEPGAVWNQLATCDTDTLLVIDQLRLGTHDSGVSLPWGIAGGESGGLRPEVIHAIDTFSSEWTAALAASATPEKATAGDTDSHTDALSQSLPRIVDALDELGLAIGLVAEGDISQRTPSSVPLAKALGQLAPDVSADWVEAADWGVWSGLLVHQGGSWWVSDHALDFAASDRATQLATLVTLWWDSAHDAVRGQLHEVISGGLSPVSIVDHIQAQFPLLDSSTLSSFFDRGHTLGALSGNRPTSLVATLIAGGDITSLRELLEPLMPPAAPGVYLDSVDSVVAAGPLSREHRESLSLVARCVRAGMAPRFVVDRDLVLASLSKTSGQELCDRLGTVIIGGVPDSLRGHIMDVESRAQALSISLDFPGALVHCQDNYLSELLLVDQKLQTLHLARVDDTTLSSKRNNLHTRQVLLDAGYPTLPVDQAPRSPRVLQTPPPALLPDSWWGEIIASAKDMPKNAVWTEDVLRDAIAERTLLALTVRVGDAERHMVVEARSIARGRLRVKDTAADVERTLPLDTIVSIHPAQPPVT